jgi:hypothetical protein
MDQPCQPMSHFSGKVRSRIPDAKSLLTQQLATFQATKTTHFPSPLSSSVDRHASVCRRSAECSCAIKPMRSSWLGASPQTRRGLVPQLIDGSPSVGHPIM